MAEEFEVAARMPTLSFPAPECGGCGETVEMEDGVAWCTACLVQWDRIEDGEVSRPDPDQEGSEVPCEIVPLDGHGRLRYGPCILPSGHEGEHNAPFSRVTVPASWGQS